MAEINVWEVLRRPRITEKGTMLSAQNKFVFEVHPVIPVEEAVRGELEVIAWRDGLKHNR